MARAKAKAGRRAGTTRAPRRSTRNRQLDDAPDEEVPDVFREMLSEALPSAADETPPLKKRKVEQATENTAPPSTAQPTNAIASADEEDDNGEDEDRPRLQTIIDDSESDESDMDWEDVDLQQHTADYFLPSLGKNQEEETLQIEIGNDETKDKPARARRKAVTAAERSTRLHIHKMHLLCLLYHSHIRNAWCNDDKVQASLKRFRSVQINNFFTPNPNQSQFQAAKAFTDGLTLAREVWKKFKITSLGIRRAKWARDAKELESFKIPEQADPVMDISDFRRAAIAFEGSADTGAMLFCAFLRTVGVDARLICSLQPLPFSAVTQPSTETASKEKSKVVHAENSSDDRTTPSPKPTPLKRITWIGRPGLSASPARQGTVASPVKPKAVAHPRYPVYWVEAFNAAQQKWVTVDPIATGTIGKPSRLEPPLSDLDVSMAYVVAFEDRGVAKDVTRRYAKAYNAKTRKSRVESTEKGDKWWRKSLKIFRRRTILDRDQVEDAELSRREAQEEMPKNVQDFKDHPYYVLERHLKHNEVIHPKREVGKVNVGTAANTNLEPIYRRRDVHQLKSADKWYRLGREIKPGEQPLKHAKPRRTRQQQPFPDEDENGEETLGAALYAPFQTELYVPPPCVRGRVPRNAFGNLDVYVPSMVPPGGLHLRDSRARLAARLLGIDYADAVTGFSFRGRHGTAVVEGAVVAAEFGDAVLAVLDGLRDLEQEEADEKRSREALRLWRKFLLGLRVLERVQEYASADEKKQMEQEMRERVEAEEREAERAAREQEMAGGFLLAEGAGDAPAEPTAGRMLAAAALDEDEYYDGGDGGGFLPDAADGKEVEEGEGEVSDDLFKSGIMDAAPLRPRSSEQGFDGAGDEDDVPIGGGGFVPDKAEKLGYDPDEAGGFIPEDGGGFDPEGGGFVPEEGGGGGGFIPEDGGGFVPEDGGGFIPDEEEGSEGGGFPKEDVPQASSLVAHGPPLETEPVAHKKVGGAMALASSATAAVNPATTANVEEVDTASEAQQMFGDQGDATRSTTTEIKGQEAALEARPQSNIGTQRSFGSDIPSDPTSRPPLKAVEAGVPEQSSSDDEMDSLPSHDPDDEDAEPEWLAEEVVSD